MTNSQRSTLLLCVLTSLVACGSAPPQPKPEPPRTVKVPVRQPLDPKEIEDCPIGAELAMTGQLHFKDLEEYFSAVEDALDLCRGRLAELRRAEARRVQQASEAARASSPAPE